MDIRTRENIRRLKNEVYLLERRLSMFNISPLLYYSCQKIKKDIRDKKNKIKTLENGRKTI